MSSYMSDPYEQLPGETRAGHRRRMRKLEKTANPPFPAIGDPNMKCPNCNSLEWFPGAACWDCGWEAGSNTTEQGHCWSQDANGMSQHERIGLKSPVCLRCGFCRPASGVTAKPCRGRLAKVGPRELMP